jgi:hypothetical protein
MEKNGILTTFNPLMGLARMGIDKKPKNHFQKTKQFFQHHPDVLCKREKK